MDYGKSITAQSVIGIDPPFSGSAQALIRWRFFCACFLPSDRCLVMAGRMEHLRVAALLGGRINSVRSATLCRLIPAGGSSSTFKESAMVAKTCLDGPYAPDLPLSRCFSATRGKFNALSERCIEQRIFLDEVDELFRSFAKLERVINRQVDAMGITHV